MSYQVQIKGRLVEDDGFRESRPSGWDANQTGTCPDCGGDWVWAEAGHVPGTRQCMGMPVAGVTSDVIGGKAYLGGCGSFFSVQQGKGGWFLRRERYY
jgi:hypothetical protein